MHPELDEELDLFVERCESAWRDSDDVDIAAILPPEDHPAHAEIAVELLRVDMDHRRSRGQSVNLDSYIDRFPAALADPARLAELAYEEYRLRLQAGESVDPSEYTQNYGVATTNWKDMAAVSTVGPSAESLVENHPSHDENLQVGAAFNDFVLERELGQGALARVFLARQTGIADRHVVLKFTSVRTFEIDRLGKLQHSNIVPVLSVHEYKDGAALCMPFLGDSTLVDVVTARRNAGAAASLPGVVREKLQPSQYERLVLDLAIGVSSGLQHAHQRDVIHGDIKPGNILIADDGQPLLLDFNLAGDLTQLRPEVVGGTFRYMPPEHKQAFQSGDSSIRPDVRSDIYSLGVVLQELIDASAMGEVGDGDERVAVVAPALAAIVSKCVAEETVDRYQTANDLLCDLQRQSDDLPLVHQPEPSVKERMSKWVRRHPRLASNASLLSIFAVIVAVASVAWMARTKQLDRANAVAEFHQFQDQVPEASALLAVRRDGIGSIEEGLELANGLLTRLKSADSYRVSELLSDEQQREQTDSIGQLLYAVAHGHWIQAESESSEEAGSVELEKARQANTRATEWFERERGHVPVAVESQAARLAGESGAHLLEEPQDGSRLEMLLYATELNDARRFDETRRYLDRMKPGFSEDVRFWTLLGSAYSGLGAHAKAETCLTASLAVNPQSWFTLTDRGLARMALKQFADAEADFAEVIRLRPNYYGGHLNRALSRSGQRSFKDAIADLDRVIELNGPTRAYFLRSRYRSVVGDREGAAADHKLGLETEPRDELSWVSRGVARMAKEPEKALEDFKRATKVNPLSLDGWRNIAHVLSERLGDPEAASKALGTIIDAGIEDSGAFAGRAVLHARAGREAHAIADIQQALQLDNQPMTRYQAACVFALLSKGNDKLKPRALALLSSSVNDLPRVLLGFADRDPDLKPIRDDPSYKKLMQASRTLYQLQNAASK